MQIMFLKENEKIKMWKLLLKKVEINEDKIIINGNINNLEFNKKRKLVSLIKNKAKCKKVILTKSLKQDRDFVNLLYSNEIEIANSKYLFKLLIKDVIEKICSSNKINTKTSEISFLINYKDKKILDVIEQIAQEFKSVHIVTNNIESFVKFSKKEYEENGIIITLTNNKKKAILRSNIIVNVDFTEELINRYVLKDDAIIINLDEKIKIKKKRFSGKIVNDFNIEFKQNSKIKQELKIEEYQNFDLKDLAQIYIINNPKEFENITVK